LYLMLQPIFRSYEVNPQHYPQQTGKNEDRQKSVSALTIIAQGWV
jgi:hypothetical protein